MSAAKSEFRVLAEQGYRPAILPRATGRAGAGAISLGFERHRGFYELACARLRAPGAAEERVSKDFGRLAGPARSSHPPARQERKTALLVFFLTLERSLARGEGNCVEVDRGGSSSWCHSLYRLTTHNPKEGGGNKWLGETFGLHRDDMDDPFSGVLRFIQCRRAGQKFIVHLDKSLFDPAAVTLSAWEDGRWQQSPKLRAEILYDLMRQVPRWAPLAAKLTPAGHAALPTRDVSLRGPWEDMPLYFSSVPLAKRVRLVGLNHQVFRRARADWRMREKASERVDLRKVGAYAEHETPAESQRRIAAEVAAACVVEPFSEELEELTVFIGSALAHDTWLRNTAFRPEDYEISEAFWKCYLAKIARLRPRAKVALYVVDDVSPLVMFLEFSDGSAFLKWTPAMFGAYHPGNPGWNLLWTPGAPPPPHFIEITSALSDLARRAPLLPLAENALPMKSTVRNRRTYKLSDPIPFQPRESMRAG